MIDGIERELGVISESLNAIRADVAEIKMRLDAYSKRIRRLELWQAGLVGGGAVIGWLLKVWAG